MSRTKQIDYREVQPGDLLQGRGVVESVSRTDEEVRVRLTFKIAWLPVYRGWRTLTKDDVVLRSS